MANILPVMRSGTVAMYGSTFSRTYPTQILTSVNDNEQRYVTAPLRCSFILAYSQVNPYDLLIFVEFFNSLKGAFVDVSLANTFSITDTRIPGAPINYCYFDQDELIATEQAINRYSFELKITQARKS